MRRHEDAADRWLRHHDPKFSAGPKGRGYYTQAEAEDPKVWNPLRVLSWDELVEQARLREQDPPAVQPIEPRIALCRVCGVELEVKERGPWPTICGRCSDRLYRHGKAAR